MLKFKRETFKWGEREKKKKIAILKSRVMEKLTTGKFYISLVSSDQDKTFLQDCFKLAHFF